MANIDRLTLMQTFGKDEKLCSKKSIDLLFEKGSSFYIAPIKVLYLKSLSSSICPIQVLISVPKKHLKLAVDRNRMKRLLREAFRKHKHLLSLQLTQKNEICSLALIYTGKQLANYSRIEAVIEKVFQRLLFTETRNEQKMD